MHNEHPVVISFAKNNTHRYTKKKTKLLRTGFDITVLKGEIPWHL